MFFVFLAPGRIIRREGSSSGGRKLLLAVNSIKVEVHLNTAKHRSRNIGMCVI